MWPHHMPKDFCHILMQMIMTLAARKEIALQELSLLLKDMPASICASVSCALATGRFAVGALPDHMPVKHKILQEPLHFYQALRYQNVGTLGTPDSLPSFVPKITDVVPASGCSASFPPMQVPANFKNMPVLPLRLRPSLHPSRLPSLPTPSPPIASSGTPSPGSGTVHQPTCSAVSREPGPQSRPTQVCLPPLINEKGSQSTVQQLKNDIRVAREYASFCPTVDVATFEHHSDAGPTVLDQASHYQGAISPRSQRCYPFESADAPAPAAPTMVFTRQLEGRRHNHSAVIGTPNGQPSRSM